MVKKIKKVDEITTKDLEKTSTEIGDSIESQPQIEPVPVPAISNDRVRREFEGYSIKN